MRIAVTGANGFLGCVIIDALQRAGHDAVALVRSPAAAGQLRAGRGLAVRLAPLDDPDALLDALDGVDAVIHAAAAKTGDYATQYAATVTGTERLLAAMHAAGVRRLVGISSFAVYDYDALAAGALLDEQAPLEAEPTRRDAYARAKLAQEAVFRGFDGDLVILRPGIIFGAGALWQFCLGRALGAGRWLRMGPASEELPWTYVDNCADAAVAAATRPAAAGACVNIVDDERPGRDAFISKLNELPETRRRVLRFPWWLQWALARLAAGVNRLAGGRLPVPGLLRPVDLQVRFKPLRYSNAAARQALDWRPGVSVDAALQASVAAQSGRRSDPGGGE